MNNKKEIDQIQSLYLFEDEEKLNEVCTLLANANVELRGRKNPNLQLSASGLVFEDEKLFFIEHPYQKICLLPAGHVELGESPEETARREFQEETGFFVEDQARLVDVNLIKIPFNEKKGEKEHWHIDFRYLLKKKQMKPELAELPVFLLTENEAPQEFQKYYHFKNK